MTEQASIDLFGALSDARGIRQLVKPPDPAPGAGLILRVPGIEEWRVESVHFTLTTSAAVANRTARLSFLDGDGAEFLAVSAGATTSAGNVRVFDFAPGLFRSNAAVANWLSTPMPAMFLEPGWGIGVTVDLIDVADTITGAALVVDKFSTGPRGPGMGVHPVIAALDMLRR